MKLLTNSLVAIGLASGVSYGATTFTETFSGSDAGPNLTQLSAADGGTQTFDGSTITFSNGTSSGNAGRTYVGTTDTDYATVDFVALIDITVQGAGDTDGNTHLFGIGAGIAGSTGGGPAFAEPVGGPAIFGGVRGIANFLQYSAEAGTPRGFNGIIAGSGTYAGAAPGAGTHTLRLSKTGDNITFSVDASQTGTFEDLFTFSSSAAGLDATNSSIFFGSAGDRTFDNLSVTVIPEPSSTLLLGLGGLALLRRRR